MKRVFILLFLINSYLVSAKTYYVSTTGNDAASGDFTHPWLTWNYAMHHAQAGDTVFFRGGVYPISVTDGTGITIDPRYPESDGGYSGTADNPICYFNYPGEVPILDCSNVTPIYGWNRGITLKFAKYIHFKGLTVRRVLQTNPTIVVGAWQIYFDCDYITTENCTVYDIGGEGFNPIVYGTGSNHYYYINCDAYNCCDSISGSPGQFGSGFSATNEDNDNAVFSFYGCRAWNCSDQGFAGRPRGYVKYDHCWAFDNSGYMNGDGHGFKTTAHDDYFPYPPINREVINCISANNAYSGFATNDQGKPAARLHWYNNFAYHNGYKGKGGGDAGVGFRTETCTGDNLTRILRNNISYANQTAPTWVENAITHDHNSWDQSVSVSDADFISLDYTQLYGARMADGSLPDITFGKLTSTSDLIDKGIDVGLPYSGVAPDLGYCESSSESATPASPVYVSSTIENDTPSILEMTYSLSLANIVPAASAFTVIVNSVARPVSSVAISGTKVLLTLSPQVAYGDAVTVAYTKPSTNPIQTAAGGQAATISAQTVTNRVAAPAVPVYVSSAIENATPSRLEMTYSLSLANIVPAISAFTVSVNSTARTVSSVAISSTKILLTLSPQVAYGDAVTVAYTKPSTNPIQSVAGGQAATISAQTVTNRVVAINIAPVVVVTFPQSSYSGFVNEINAGGSYDANKDNLTITWSAPASVPLSSTSGAIIKFLGPIVNEPTTVEFTVKVSDGKTTQSKVIPIKILPYKPELETAEISNIEASSFQAPNFPQNILDGNIGTIWAANGDDQWLILKLKQSFSVQHVKLAFQPGQKKESYFDIFGSVDKVNWEPILTKSASCAFSGNIQVFEFPPSKADKEFNYIKLVGLGNSADSWNYVSELKIFGNRHINSLAYEKLAAKIYPNPAKEYLTIRIDNSTLIPDFIQLIDLSGSVIYRQNEVDHDLREFTIPIHAKSGTYIVQLGACNMTLFTQKLIVEN
jgi:uncharacterized repeat protein (TIGR02059 family)